MMKNILISQKSAQDFLHKSNKSSSPIPFKEKMYRIKQERDSRNGTRDGIRHEIASSKSHNGLEKRFSDIASQDCSPSRRGLPSPSTYLNIHNLRYMFKTKAGQFLDTMTAEEIVSNEMIKNEFIEHVDKIYFDIDR